MKPALTGFCAVAALLGAGTAPLMAQSFNRIASFTVSGNLPEGSDPAQETSAEIITATDDGMMLVYSDSPAGRLGMIDITDPRQPRAAGSVALGGEPTSVGVIGMTAFVGINTSESYTNPSGHLAAITLPTGEETARCDLGGQPDSVAVARDGSFVTVAIENERDEDLNDGQIPQMPAGYVVILPVRDGAPDCAAMITVDMTGFAEIAPTDPEPEFVDVNGLGEIVVTLQENNALAVIGPDGTRIAAFSAGSVDLEGIDATRDGKLSFTESLKGVLREPDTVKWIDDTRFAIANEGDYQGGSRGWSIFSKSGELLYESGPAFEHAVVQIGHYPEKRSNKKGVEPEAIAAATYGDTSYVFVGSERGSVIGVYRLDGDTPELVQMLPSGIAPEGIVTIPSRNLLVSANEKDLVEDGGVRAHVMIYELQDAPAAYPSITSAGADELIGWGALSGLAAHPTEPGHLYAVNDSFYAMQPTIFEIDATAEPARITRAIRVTRGGDAAQKLDLEGIFADADGTFWLGSEGRGDRLIPHAIYHVDAAGEIRREIPLPAALLAAEKRFGIEGITRVGDTLWVAIQREWQDDPKGLVKLVAFDLDSGEWGAVHYPLDPVETGWIGLSEITAHGDHVYIIERDNQIGAAAKVKQLTRVALSEMQPAPLGGPLPVVTKEVVRDFLPDLAAPNGYVVDKIEGFAIDAAGQGYAVTDNDGVDDSSGETHFFKAGTY